MDNIGTPLSMPWTANPALLPEPRGDRYLDNPLTFNVQVPSGAPTLQADFITADLIVNQEKREMFILEFNGSNSGLTGYARFHPWSLGSTTNLHAQFFKGLVNQGCHLVGILPDNPYRLFPERLYHEGFLDLIRVGGQ